MEESGLHKSYSSGMVRSDDKGKPRYDLIPTWFLTDLAHHYGLGAKMFGENNWQKSDTVEELQRFKASAWRHFVQYLNGEDDEDHLCAAVFNMIAVKFIKDKVRTG